MSRVTVMMPAGRPAVSVYAPERTPETPHAWQDDALCAQTDPELFHPIKGGSTREPKKVCASCTVAAQCLEYALANDQRGGIWGGKSDRERRKIQREAAA